MAAGEPPIVLVHGFTQTSTSWRPVRELLEARWDRVIAVDAPGHGSAADVQVDLHGAAEHLTKGLEPGARPIVVGYSMGGRMALRLAIDHPELVGGLVLLGATAGIDDPDERAARRRSDEALADSIERDGVALFIERWLRQPIFAGLEPEADDRAARLVNTAAGLASSLRLAGTGTMDPPWWDELGAIEVPVLVTWGERDAKFAALGQRIAETVGPWAATAVVPDAGHAAHLERPATFASIVERFARGLHPG